MRLTSRHAASKYQRVWGALLNAVLIIWKVNEHFQTVFGPAPEETKQATDRQFYLPQLQTTAVLPGSPAGRPRGTSPGSPCWPSRRRSGRPWSRWWWSGPCPATAAAGSPGTCTSPGPSCRRSCPARWLLSLELRRRRRTGLGETCRLSKIKKTWFSC